MISGGRRRGFVVSTFDFPEHNHYDLYYDEKIKVRTLSYEEFNIANKRFDLKGQNGMYMVYLITKLSVEKSKGGK